MKINNRLSFLYKKIDNPIDKINRHTKTKIKICLGFCFVSSVIGMIIGWKIGEQKGIAELPPNAWAGDGMGILDKSIDGSGWGALIGLCFGLVCCLILSIFAWRRKSLQVVSQVGTDESQVWPPAPTHIP